jgi:4'-phosphopantetheinyl transferase EntD
VGDVTPHPWRVLLPATVTVVQATEQMWSTPASARERVSIARAVPHRQREYQAGRAAARAALRQLGIAEFDLLPGESREPIWPEGVVGSLTHAAGYCAAAVARKSNVRALGIDVEAEAALQPDLVDRICSSAERHQLDHLDGRPGGVWAKLIFSAKEAFYKAYFPEVRRFLEFHDVRVEIDAVRGTFEVDLCGSVPPLLGETRVTGRFVISDSLIFTAVSLPASRAGQTT